MTRTVRKILSRAEALLAKGEYRNSLELVETIAGQKGLSVDNRLVCSLLESRIWVKQGELKKALSLADEVLNTARERKTPLLAVDALIVRAEISWRSGKLDEGLLEVEKGEKLLARTRLEDSGVREEEIKRRRGKLLHHGGVIHWYKGDLDQALEYHQRSLLIKEDLGDRQGIGNSFNNLGLVYVSKGDLDQAQKYYQQSLTIMEALGNKRNIAASLNNLGIVHTSKGNLDQSLEYYKRSLAIQEELGIKQDIAHSVVNIGVVYQLKGDLNEALECYQRSLVISETLEIKQDIALALNNLGDIYQLKGDLNQALQHHQRSLALYRGLNIKQGIALTLTNIGATYRRKGSPEEALDYYQQSLILYEKMGNDPLVAIVLFELLSAALERKDPALGQKYLQKLRQINERTNNRAIDQRFRVAKALSLKTSKRIRHKMKAVEILEQVVDEEVANHSLTIIAMIHLCDLLLSELKMTGENELFGEIKELTSRLLEIAKQQSSHSLLAETYLLKSKLALIELNIGQARKFLTKAHLITQEKGLHMLAQAVTHERDSLSSQMHKWESIVEQKPPKREIIDLTGLDDLLERMVKKAIATSSLRDEVPKKKYKLMYLNLLKDSPKNERNDFRVGVAQIGLSQKGDILHEFYKEQTTGLFGLREDVVEFVGSKVKNMVEIASTKGINILIFPELTIDLNYDQLFQDILSLAKIHKMYIIPGSYHDQKTRQNLCVVISPSGILWKQRKHIPAVIRFGKKRLVEGINTEARPREIVIGNTEYGRIAVVICRDFLDMDLRVELKNSEPPIDLVINPSFTPVTTDFKAAHFDARRSIYAYCFFANVAEFGDSLIYTPEKERIERNIPPREENLIYKDIDLFKLRSERKKWEIEHARKRPFIQSTR